MKSMRERDSRPSGPAAGAALRRELVDPVDDVEEAAASPGPDAGPGDRDGEMGRAGAGTADQHDVALMREEVAARQLAHEGLVDCVSTGAWIAPDALHWCAHKISEWPILDAALYFVGVHDGRDVRATTPQLLY